jgi:hypothetical protein
MHSWLQNHMVHKRMSCTRWEETLGITVFNELPKEVPHGYACTYISNSSNTVCSIQQAAGRISGMDADKQAWLAKYATGPSHDNTYSAPGAQTAD